jgi:transcriptional regulator with XRE-family HTH domain
MNLGDTARNLRESFGLTQRAAAERLGISSVHLCNIEKDKSRPSPELMAKYREVFGIDLYVYSWCSQPNLSKVPPGMREATQRLADLWQTMIEHRRSNFSRECK